MAMTSSMTTTMPGATTATMTSTTMNLCDLCGREE
ncbi:uncharacterized protein G2W53_038653 [Senna tora]|uniref:Uncharacterized protein n=1 Tax=Senna tora TaxID=362788 RepID=A0A834SS31_9FABA|nr:uncharacterized protein G2W53_038653 [Senna tora]